MKDILYSDEARNRIMAGASKVSKLAALTAGPKGRNVVLERDFGGALICNDGITILKDITFEDQFENLGAQLIIEASSKTNSGCGDGTTATAILAEAIMKEGLRNVAAGANPLKLKKGISKGVEMVITELSAVPVDSKEKIAQVATVSAQDSDVGSLIADIFDEIGHDGIITVEESQGTKIEKEIVKGMAMDSGYISPYMATDPVRMEAEYHKPLILVTDHKISSVQDLIPIFNKVAEKGLKQLVIIAEDVTGEALGTVVINHLKGNFSVLAIKAPYYGERKKDALKDIAIATKATLISSELGMKFTDIKFEDFGSASKVISDKDKTVIIEGAGDADERVKELKLQLEKATSEFDKEKLSQRIAHLSGGVGVIKVGAATETELKEKKLRIEDAVSATKAAVEEGIVAGGGSALFHVSQKLTNLEVHGDEGLGVQIVLDSISAPLKQIALNAGIDPGAITERLRFSPDETGYDAEEDTVCDLFEKGIVDPKKVVRLSLENAASVAGTFITMDAAVVTQKKEGDKGSLQLPR